MFQIYRRNSESTMLEAATDNKQTNRIERAWQKRRKEKKLPMTKSFKYNVHVRSTI